MRIGHVVGDMDIGTVEERAGTREFSPKDDLPGEYRRAATRMIQFHANSEIMGGYLERPFIRQSPGLDRKLAFSAKVQDEIGHGQLLYRAAELLGVKTREDILRELATGSRRERGGHRRADVRLVWSPPWTVEFVTDDGREALREFGVSV